MWALAAPSPRPAGAEGWPGPPGSTLRARCPCAPDGDGEGMASETQGWACWAAQGVEKWITLNSVSRATLRNSR